MPGSLRLSYFAAEVTLHRAIIRFDTPTLDEHLRSITRGAARMRFTSAIDLVSRLEPAHLQCFWYFSSKVNLAIIATFGSLLWATSDNQEEAEFYKSQLAEYRWTLRVSSKAAEFMKFTVGMLDASPVFLKDNTSKSSKTTTPLVPPAPEDILDRNLEQRNFDANTGQSMHDFNSDMYGVSNEVSPSIGASTENAYGYEIGPETVVSNHTDTRPNWGDFAGNVNFTPGDIQDWSLDQLYSFENFQVAEDILATRRFIEEYDETGNNFAGF